MLHPSRYIHFIYSISKSVTPTSGTSSSFQFSALYFTSSPLAKRPFNFPISAAIHAVTATTSAPQFTNWKPYFDLWAATWMSVNLNLRQISATREVMYTNISAQRKMPNKLPCLSRGFQDLSSCLLHLWYIGMIKCKVSHRLYSISKQLLSVYFS